MGWAIRRPGKVHGYSLSPEVAGAERIGRHGEHAKGLLSGGQLLGGGSIVHDHADLAGHVLGSPSRYDDGRNGRTYYSVSLSGRFVSGRVGGIDTSLNVYPSHRKARRSRVGQVRPRRRQVIYRGGPSNLCSHSGDGTHATLLAYGLLFRLEYGPVKYV